MRVSPRVGELIWSRAGVVLAALGLVMSVAGGAVGGLVSRATKDAQIEARVTTVETRQRDTECDLRRIDDYQRGQAEAISEIRAGVNLLLDAHKLREPKE